MTNIVIANMWQVFISVLYLTLNGILSFQLIANEWFQFGHNSKTLRVSHPEGIQRGTFFVSMPLRYGLPTRLVFGVEHWLISQSMFVIRTLISDWDGKPLPGLTTSGHSVIPALIGTL